jgi:methylated-DNA-protein-cysteine methyltransferase-like protein
VRREPRGSVATYGDIADAVQPPCNPRLIGRALGKAPPGLTLPWHRILAAGGRIALPAHHGLEQRLRLESEGVTFAGKRARLEIHHWEPRKQKKRGKRGPAAAKNRARKKRRGSPPRGPL